MYTSNRGERLRVLRIFFVEKERIRKWSTSLAVTFTSRSVAKKYGSRRDCLRSTNKQHSHPVIRWRMPLEEAGRWRTQLLEMSR